MRALLAIFCTLAAAGSAIADAPPMPKPLACYKRYYDLDSELRDGRWYLKLPSPSGEALLYDDAQTKDLQTRLVRPDVEDQFAMPYQKGPLVRVKEVDHDPGRVRVNAILRAIYSPTGNGPKDPVEIVDWFGTQLRVHPRIAKALSRVRERIVTAIAAEPSLRPWLDRPGGGYAHRRIAGTDRLSPHSFGIAIDIDPKRTEYWRWDRDFSQAAQKSAAFARPVPTAIVAAFEAEGFIWGGRWYHYDTMHFEFRPELLDPQCAP